MKWEKYNGKEYAEGTKLVIRTADECYTPVIADGEGNFRHAVTLDPIDGEEALYVTELQAPEVNE